MSYQFIGRMTPNINQIIDKYLYYAIFQKIFERLVHQKLYSFLHHNTLLSSNNSGFHSGDSTINQLTSITHNIYKAIDKGKDIRVVFLDMSKAVDKVWHKGIVHKAPY